MEAYQKMQLSLFWSSGIIFIYQNVCSSCKLLDINVFISKLQNTGQKKKKELEETTFSGCLLNAQETNHQAFHKGWRKVLHFTKHYIKVHKNCLVWVLEIERKAWISSQFKSVLVVTVMWQLIWNGPLGNDHSKAELIDIYWLAKLRLSKPKLYILSKIQYTFWATTICLFFLFLWTLISPKTELILVIISLSKLLWFLSPASNNLKGKNILNII